MEPEHDSLRYTAASPSSPCSFDASARRKREREDHTPYIYPTVVLYCGRNLNQPFQDATPVVGTKHVESESDLGFAECGTKRVKTGSKHIRETVR